MSGGYFEYKQYHIDDIAEKIEQVIRLNGSDVKNEYGDRLSQDLSPETIHQMQEGLRIIKKAAIHAQRIDWLLSGDDGEDSYRDRLKEDMASHLTALPVPGSAKQEDFDF